MVYIVTSLTAVLIVAAMWRAFTDSRDALHPAMYLGPMFAFSHVHRPNILYIDGWLDLLFDPGQLLFVLTINAAGIGFLLLGTLWNRVPALDRASIPTVDDISSAARTRAAVLATFFGTVAILSFIYTITQAGGFASAYGRAKGGGYAATGYIGELPLLSLPAIGLFALAWAGLGITPGRVAALLAIGSMYIFHGVMGARRGPTFMILMALLVAFHLISGKRAKLWVILLAVGIVGALMLWLVRNRDRIYIGTDWETQDQSSTVYRTTTGTETGEDFAYSAGVILTSQTQNVHYWGYRYLAHLLVQPIPRQFWPYKYDDVGLGWLADQSAMEGLTDNEWISAVGWRPARGAAAGIIADFFLEFSYAGLLACFAIGWLYSYLWKQSVCAGGVWRALYLFAVILSIYIPTQNFNAWYYRYLIMAVPTLLVWRFYLVERPASRLSMAYQA